MGIRRVIELMSCHLRGGHHARLDWSQPTRVPQHETAYVCARFALLEACMCTGIVFILFAYVAWVSGVFVTRCFLVGGLFGVFESRFSSPPRPPRPPSSPPRPCARPLCVSRSRKPTVNLIHEAEARSCAAPPPSPNSVSESRSCNSLLPAPRHSDKRVCQRSAYS